MQRDLAALADQHFDIIVVGGGIFGICTAWDAALRGLSVCLIEQGDFGHATSASHYKVVHGGIRYLQHADFARVRESSRERSAFLTVAPHLVYPMPFVIPTYGHGMKGSEVMQVALKMYDLTTADRNRNIRDESRYIPSSHVTSAQEAIEQFPFLPSENLTGAAVFHDGQMYNPARLSLAFVQAAAQIGAVVANYAEVVQFLRTETKITGVAVRDKLHGEEFEVRGSMVINAAGPWTKWLLHDGNGLTLRKTPVFSRDAYFIVKRKLVQEHALAIQGITKDPDAVLSRGNRHLFLVPWRDYTLVGVWHVVFDGRPETFTLTESEVQTFIDEVNAGTPELKLTLDDVCMWNAGLTLFGENEPGATHLSYGKRSMLIDHRQEHGLDGLISLVGVRFTTGRGMAEKAVNLALTKMGKRARPCQTLTQPIHGGRFDSFTALRASIAQAHKDELQADTATALAHNHGERATEVLSLLKENRAWAKRLGDSSVVGAEVIHSVRREMAHKLGDVVFRRTDLGSGANPGIDAITECAHLMAGELNWTQREIEREVQDVTNRYSDWLSAG